MEVELSIRDLLVAISRMPEGRRGKSGSVWYESQKEHWIGWLFEYPGPGAYNRKVHGGRDARFAYNHLVCPDMLLFLARGSGVSAKLVRAAERAQRQSGPTLMAKCRVVRQHLPWPVVHEALRQSGLLSASAMGAR